MADAPYCYEFPRPMSTVDAVLMAVRDGRLEVLLIKRGIDPCAGLWALPGGFIDANETLEAAVARELEEETGLNGIRLTQLHTFGDPGRDPRGHSISTAYLALVDASRLEPKADDDARDVAWRPVSETNDLAFDHAKIVAFAAERLRSYTAYAGVGAQALSRQFTLDELRRLYEGIDGVATDAPAFEARMTALGVLTRADNGLFEFAAGRVAPV